MSTLAQEEADRFFDQKEHHTSHPEDRSNEDSDQNSECQPEQEKTTSSDHDDDNDDEDTLHHNSNMSSATAGYHVPFRRFDGANTGPKGVIADAQAFNRAKQSTFRKTLNNFTNALSLKTSPSPQPASHSGSEEDGEDGDEEFMRQWRQNRLRELQVQQSTSAVRRQSPSQRTWGRLDAVDASGYLDAIERVAADQVVVVCIYDPESSASAEVEDVLGTIAYKHSTVRFVKLHHEIAEMNHVGVPAVLAYRGGEVFVTLSDVRPEGLETLLRREGVLK